MCIYVYSLRTRYVEYSDISLNIRIYLSINGTWILQRGWVTHGGWRVDGRPWNHVHAQVAATIVRVAAVVLSLPFAKLHKHSFIIVMFCLGLNIAAGKLQTRHAPACLNTDQPHDLSAPQSTSGTKIIPLSPGTFYSSRNNHLRAPASA